MARTITYSGGKLVETGATDARGNKVLKNPVTGDTVTQQGSQLILSKPGSSTGAQVAPTASPLPNAAPATSFNDSLAAEKTPIRRFGLILQNMLKTYQGVRADQLDAIKNKQGEIVNDSLDATLAETPADLKGFSPSTQAAIRDANANVRSGEAKQFTSAVSQQDSRSQAFLDTVDKTWSMAKEMYGSELEKPDDATLNGYKQMVESGKMKLSDVPDKALPYVVGVIDASKIPVDEKEALETEKLRKEIALMGQMTPEQWATFNLNVAEKFPGDPVAAKDIILNGSKSSWTPQSSLYDFFAVYAPKGDGNNDPISYARSVAKKLGIDANTPFASLANRVDEFAQAIADHEGFTNGTSGYAVKNNNPGNLRFIGQEGAVEGSGGFAKFATVADGFNALKNDILAKMNRAKNNTNNLKPLMADTATAQKDKDAAETAQSMKENALNSAQQLLTKFDSGVKGAVGTSGIFNKITIPGSKRADFIVQFNNLKSLMSLENVKLLKGQGQVSDAERRLLDQASAKLDLNQSESEFRSALAEIIQALGGSEAGGGENSVTAPDGQTYKFPTAEAANAFKKQLGI